MLSTALIALLVTGAFGYFLWVEITIPFFKSFPGCVEDVDPVCFLSSKGRSSAKDCDTVRARAGKKPVCQMYRNQSPAEHREQIETSITGALGPVQTDTTWKLLAHTSAANRIQSVNNAGRCLPLGVSVLLFVILLRRVVNNFVRHAIQPH